MNTPDIPRELLVELRDLIRDVERWSMQVTAEASTIGLEARGLQWSGRYNPSDVVDSAECLREASNALGSHVSALRNVYKTDIVMLYGLVNNLD